MDNKTIYYAFLSWFKGYTSSKSLEPIAQDAWFEAIKWFVANQECKCCNGKESFEVKRPKI